MNNRRPRLAATAGTPARAASLVLAGLGGLTALAFFALMAGEPVPLLAGILTKPVPILCLALWMSLHRGGRTRAGLLARLGLIASAAGDVMLLLPDAFTGGLACFFLAHTLYVASFSSQDKNLHIARALPFFGFSASMFLLLLPRLQALTLPVAAYCLIIAAMGWRAAARVGSDGPPRAAWLGVAGAALFMASDGLIAVNTFHTPVPHADYAIMITYYLGQTGIAWSVARSTPHA